MFHTLIVLSQHPENSRDPSADTHTEYTDSVCPPIVCMYGKPSPRAKARSGR